MKPRDLADEISNAVVTFKLPVAEARTKAREVINCAATNGIIPVIENWRLNSDGQVEFAIRNLQNSD
jgi:hypothetical protein